MNAYFIPNFSTYNDIFYHFVSTIKKTLSVLIKYQVKQQFK